MPLSLLQDIRVICINLALVHSIMCWFLMYPMIALRLGIHI